MGDELFEEAARRTRARMREREEFLAECLTAHRSWPPEIQIVIGNDGSWGVASVWPKPPQWRGFAVGDPVVSDELMIADGRVRLVMGDTTPGADPGALLLAVEVDRGSAAPTIWIGPAHYWAPAADPIRLCACGRIHRASEPCPTL